MLKRVKTGDILTSVRFFGIKFKAENISVYIFEFYIFDKKWMTWTVSDHVGSTGFDFALSI
jgi:hypothetical protein